MSKKNHSQLLTELKQKSPNHPRLEELTKATPSSVVILRLELQRLDKKERGQQKQSHQSFREKAYRRLDYNHPRLHELSILATQDPKNYPLFAKTCERVRDDYIGVRKSYQSEDKGLPLENNKESPEVPTPKDPLETHKEIQRLRVRRVRAKKQGNLKLVQEINDRIEALKKR